MKMVAKYVESEIKSKLISDIKNLGVVVKQNNMQIKLLKDLKQTFQASYINEFKKSHINFKEDLIKDRKNKIESIHNLDTIKHFPKYKLIDMSGYNKFCYSEKGIDERLRDLQDKSVKNQKKLDMLEEKATSNQYVGENTHRKD